MQRTNPYYPQLRNIQITGGAEFFCQFLFSKPFKENEGDY
jgi:hypothetical protein